MMQVHEQRVEDLSRSYQNAQRQQQQFVQQMRMLFNNMRSWFSNKVESVPGVDSRMEPQTVQIKHR